MDSKYMHILLPGTPTFVVRHRPIENRTVTFSKIWRRIKQEQKPIHEVSRVSTRPKQPLPYDALGQINRLSSNTVDIGEEEELQNIYEEINNDAEGRSSTLTEKYEKLDKTFFIKHAEKTSTTLCQKITRHQFDIHNRISHGKYSSLHVGVYAKTRCSIIKSREPGEIQWILCQLRALQSIISHENIIEAIAYNVSQGDTIVFMLLTNLENGDLKTYLKSKTRESNKEQHLHFATQIASGMKFIYHQKEAELLSLQVSASNVLLDGTLTCKINNFASAIEVRERRTQLISSNDLSISPWMSPECHVSEDNHTNASDVWAYGVLLYEIVTNGGDPFPDVKLENIGSYVMEGNTIQAPDNSDHMYMIMKKCWSFREVDRPSWDDLLSDIEHKQAEYSPVYEIATISD